MGMTLADEYDMDIQNHPSAAYKAKGDDWYVISYLENDRIYYKKCFINGEYWNTWYLIILPGWQTAIIINALLSSLHLHPVGNPAELFTDKLNA